MRHMDRESENDSAVSERVLLGGLATTALLSLVALASVAG